MRKYTFAILTMLLFFTILFNPVASAATEINVILNGKNIDFNPTAYEANGNTMVTFQQLFEQLGATASYDEKTKIIKAYKDDTEIQLTLNSMEALLNGEKYTLIQAPWADDYGIIYVNLRFISEAFGYKVRWEKSTLTVHITSK